MAHLLGDAQDVANDGVHFGEPPCDREGRGPIAGCLNSPRQQGARGEPPRRLVWTEGFADTLPPGVDFPFEDAVIMSDALLWFAQQPLHCTGQVLGIGDLRERNAVRPFTPAQRDTR